MRLNKCKCGSPVYMRDMCKSCYAKDWYLRHLKSDQKRGRKFVGLGNEFYFGTEIKDERAAHRFVTTDTENGDQGEIL